VRGPSYTLLLLELARDARRYFVPAAAAKERTVQLAT
jgi:hypothetical protein